MRAGQTSSKRTREPTGPLDPPNFHRGNRAISSLSSSGAGPAPGSNRCRGSTPGTDRGDRGNDAVDSPTTICTSSVFCRLRILRLWIRSVQTFSWASPNVMGSCLDSASHSLLSSSTGTYLQCKPPRGPTLLANPAHCVCAFRGMLGIWARSPPAVKSPHLASSPQPP